MSLTMLAAEIKWKLDKVRPRNRFLIDLLEGWRVLLWAYACGHSLRYSINLGNIYFKLPFTLWDNRNVFRLGRRRK